MKVDSVRRDEEVFTEREGLGSNKLCRVFFPSQIVVTAFLAASLPFPTLNLTSLGLL